MCPDVTNLSGTCDERCSSDDECSDGQLCCSNGCGHACMDTVLDCSVSNGCVAACICLIDRFIPCNNLVQDSI